MLTRILAVCLLFAICFAHIGCSEDDECVPQTVSGFEKTDISYRVQIGAFSQEKDVTTDDFFTALPGNTEVEVEEIADAAPGEVKYRYYAGGEFADYTSATDYRDTIEENYDGSFVVAFGNDNTRIGDVTETMRTQLCL